MSWEEPDLDKGRGASLWWWPVWAVLFVILNLGALWILEILAAIVPGGG